jgi:DNA polymerase-3 subunit delta
VRGDDPGEVAAAVRRLVHDLVGDADPAMAVEEHGGAGDELQVGPVVDALTTPPFLVARRVVVVRDAGRLVAGDVPPIVQWIEAPVPGVHLVLAAGGGTVPASLVKAIERHGQVIDVTIGTGAARGRWVADQVRGAAVRLDGAAQALLADHAGDDAATVRSVLGALEAAFGPGATVGVEDIEPYLGVPGQVAPWALTDAIDRGDTAGAIDVLRRLLGPGEMHPLAVLTVLHRHYQTMLRLDGADVARPEDAAALVGARSVFPVRKAMEQGRRLGSERVAQAIGLLADADLDLRGASALPDQAVMEVLVGRLSRLVPARRPGPVRR